jgi:methionyl-tRNA formyltransferase
VKVVFMGTPETALPALDAILAAGHVVPLVVTQPDRPVGRSKSPRPPPVKTFALARGLSVIQPFKVRTVEFHHAIVAACPDVLAVVAYGRILPRPVLEAAPHGAINLHFSLLPAYRGAAPVQWALARAESETGVTTFRLDEGLDTGELLAQRPVSIEPGERAPALLGRLAIAGAPLLVETLAGLATGTLTPVRQDERRATLAPILTRHDGDWDPAWTASELAGRVRGFDPWPGVWAVRSGKRLRIVEARAESAMTTGASAGTIVELDGEAVRIACGGGTSVLVGQVQPEGGRSMSARAAVNGRLLLPGDRLERPESPA